MSEVKELLESMRRELELARKLVEAQDLLIRELFKRPDHIPNLVIPYIQPAAPFMPLPHIGPSSTGDPLPQSPIVTSFVSMEMKKAR